MSNLGTAYVQIVPTAKGIKGSIENTLSGEAESAGTAVGTKVGSFAKKAIAAAAVGAALVSGIKASIDEGAKLQQSYLGGLDTLYGEAADAAREYAKEAASAGISMNDYSEQAVSFGAALKAAYGGDTKKAVEAANTAILDMADNAAKMGTPLESVQQAYQGFAKGQYQLLDNLKLGYGGTKTEMERLLKDAQALTGVEYNIDNLGDVYDAIHAIQGNLGLTGVAASEAAETFSGSFNAMKAAAQNVLGTLALGEDIQPALKGLMGAVNTFVTGNLIPMIGTIIKGLPTVIATFVSEGLPALITKFNGFLSNAAKTLTDKANSLSAEKVALWAQTMIPKLLAKAGELIGKLAQGLITNIPKIVVAVGKIGLEIVKGLGQAIWPKITAAANTIKDKFLAPINTLKEKVKGVIDKIKGFFSFNVKLPHIPLPHFSVSPAGWKLSDLLKGQLPSLGIEWYAKGGIATNPAIVGIGEGTSNEAILPLTPFWKKMDEIIDATNGNTTINVYGSPGMDVEELANAVERKIVNKVYRRNTAWGTT